MIDIPFILAVPQLSMPDVDNSRRAISEDAVLVHRILFSRLCVMRNGSDK